MKKEELFDMLRDFENANSAPHSFYIGYHPSENCVHQKWGKYSELSELIEEIDSIGYTASLGMNLPIVRLIIYADDQCMAIMENSLWDPVHCDSADSHTCVCVPYVLDGKFAVLAEEPRSDC